ncbi:MAG: hypothetical protein QM581_08455 [Pseudomonas sp.]
MSRPRIPLLLALLLSATASAPALADDACTGTFRAKIQPILNTKCVACHQDAAPADGLSLQRTAAPASLIGVRGRNAPMPLVTPGDPQQSYLLHKIDGSHLKVGGQGMQMPVGGKLGDDDIKAITSWIAGCKRA